MYEVWIVECYMVWFMSMFSIVYFKCVNRNRKDGLFEYILLVYRVHIQKGIVRTL